MIGPNERKGIGDLLEFARSTPMAAKELVDLSEHAPDAFAAFMQQHMIDLPINFRVGLTYECQPGHMDLVAHVSILVATKGRLPNQQAVTLLMETLGFKLPEESLDEWMKACILDTFTEHLAQGQSALHFLLRTK
jgi:hypothetical protein